ncbi:MAG: integrase arm-type DNA-binding domain-containing protein, partial [Rhodospirillales bacterium]
MAINLTAKFVEAPTAGTSRKEIPDGLLPGLYLVVQPSGAKSWAIRYRHGGKPRKMTLGPAAPKLGGSEPTPTLGAPLTLAGARVVAREQLQIVAAGRDPALEHVAAKRAARDPATVDRDLFGTVARTFIKRYAKPKNKSWRETARLLGLRPDPENDDLVTIPSGLAGPKVWGRRRVQEITRREIIDLLDGIVDRGSPVAANATLAALRKLFNWSVERGTIDASPAAGVKPPGSVKSRDRVLSDNELATVWRAARATPYP